MDGLKPGRGSHGGREHSRSHASRLHSGRHNTSDERNSGQKYWLVRSLGKVASKRKVPLWDKFLQTDFAHWPDKSIWHRLYATAALVLLLFSVIVTAIQPLLNIQTYKLSQQSRSIIPQPNAYLGKILAYKAKEQAYVYNEGYKAIATTTANSLQKSGNGDPRFSASLAKQPSQGVKLTDSVNNANFTLKPKYKLGEGRQNANQIVYPLSKADGFLVYTAQLASIKEDIVLQTPTKDTMQFDYELGLEDGLEARMEKNGSVGIYGSSLPLYGNVATGSDKDAELLKKAKDNSKKDKFLFGIPAPFVKESGVTQSSVSTHFELKGNKLKIVVKGLKQASYPLTIDPSVYIQSAAQLMSGNNETNVAFDVATEQFKKGFTTGARINNWTETGVMNDATYDQSVAAFGGYVYRAGGRSGRIMPWIASSKQTLQSTTTSASFTMDMPTTRPAGDLYIAVISHDVNGTNTITVPSGWNTIQEPAGREFGMYYKVGTDQGGGNEAAQYTWTKAGNNVQWAGVILRIKDYGSTTFTSANNSGTSGNITFPTITVNASGGSPSGNGALVLRAAGLDDDTISVRNYSPTNMDDISSGMSGGATGVGYVVSRYDSPPDAGAVLGTATSPTAEGYDDSFGAATVAIYGASATPAYNQTVQWAHFNSSTGSIDSPAPGSNAVACSGWCTNSAYNLPTGSGSSSGAGNVGAAMVAYNGYLYYMGGADGTAATTNIKNTVYIAKLGANGEPQKWHPTLASQGSWNYWYQDSGLSGGTALQYLSAYAYNGKMYVLGGDSDLSNNTTGAVTTVKIADILPNGTLGTWSSGTALSSARYGASVQAYNGYLYILGGNSGSASLTNVDFTRLNSDGTMNSWQNAAADGAGGTFSTGRASMGGVMSGIWGGYIYIAGGCNTVNASGYCTTFAPDVQIASINADGTLDTWNTILALRQARFGSSFVAWQDSLYRFGGCSKQDTTSGDCYATHLDVQYGNINQDGDASTVSLSTASGTAPCSGTAPYNCNLPNGGTGAGTAGQALVSTAILNGYLYMIGGCTAAACSAMTGNTAYVAIDSNGQLKSPPTCAGTTSGAWCVDDTNQINGTTGVGAAATAVFGGYVYIIGGHQGNGTLRDQVYRNKANADGSWQGAWTAQKISAALLNNTLAATSITYSYAYARANPSNAGTYPGNLYIVGGCTSLATASGTSACDAWTQNVYKCNIMTDGSIDHDGGLSGGTHNPCSTTNQLQIGTINDGVNGNASGTGLGMHAGAVYANYIYLMGGSAPGKTDLVTIRYAKFDNSNNIVAVSGSAWVNLSASMGVSRSRGSAFGYNGYLYVVGGYNNGGTGVLRDIQFGKINVGTGDVASFSTSVVTISQRWALGLAVSNSYAYVIGGCKTGTPPTCTALDNTVLTFQVYNNDSGAPAAYTSPTGTSLFTTDRIGAAAAVYNGYMYIAGGCTGTTECASTTSNVQYASISASGTVGAWANTSNVLTAGRGFGQMEVVGGTLYFIGGQTGANANTSVNTIYYATPAGSGDITSSWQTATKGIGDTSGTAQKRTQFSSAVWNNRLYVVGGYDGQTTPAVQATVFVSPQLNSGGDITTSWTSTTAFNVARSGNVVITYANNIYVIGGYDGTNYLSDVQFAKIDSSGTVGSWTYTTNMPSPIRQADGFAVNGYMYIFGGRSSTNDCAARTLIAPISANTTIASGNNPTGIGEWYQTNRNFDGGRYGAAALYSQGKAYLLGGGCQGIVMSDDFDGASSPYYDSNQWTSVSNMAADYRCKSNSITRTLSGTQGGTGGTGAIATSKDWNVSSGGTIFFKLYTPTATIDTGGGNCYVGESPLILNRDGVQLEYSTNGGGAWTPIGGQYATVIDPMQPQAVTIPAGAQTSSTRFRWYLNNAGSNDNDSFALEDVYISATNSTTMFYETNSRVTITPLLSQPQTAIYSRQIDAGSDVFPKNWLMNGTDNSIGARWQMAYRSMNDPLATVPCGGSAMTTYGQTTNTGDVTLGMPGVYTVKNGSGTNISCGRYFFMTISIDASPTYGYPDDIDRGPTLDNLLLFYNSNPGKRLIHGKTFTEGIQQPLDTPCSYGGVANNVNCPLP